MCKIDRQDLENSQIDWARYQPNQAVAFKDNKTLLGHPKRALLSVASGLQNADRGNLIMACGTGKAFTNLKVAE